MPRTRAELHEQLLAEVTDHIVLLLRLDELVFSDFMPIHQGLCRIVSAGISLALDARAEGLFTPGRAEKEIEDILLSQLGGRLNESQRARLVRALREVAREEARRVALDRLMPRDN
jgi:hypothetical protein